MKNIFKTKEDLAVAEKKALLGLIFKKIIVKEGKITDYELYEPFKTILLGVEVECQLKEIQVVTEKPDAECTYAPLAAR